MVEVGRDPVVFLHDGTFEGFLSTIFEAVRLRLPVVAVEAASRHVPGLLESTREVATDMDAARRKFTRERKLPDPQALGVPAALARPAPAGR